MEIKRGQVYWCNLNGDLNNHVQDGYRPVLVVSNNVGNHYAPVVTVVPITTRHTSKKLPTHVPVRLLKGSLILCEQPVTIPKNQMHDYITTLNDDVMSKVANAIKIALGLIGGFDDYTRHDR